MPPQLARTRGAWEEDVWSARKVSIGPIMVSYFCPSLGVAEVESLVTWGTLLGSSKNSLSHQRGSLYIWIYLFSRWSFVSPSSGPGVISTTSFLPPLGQDLKQPHTVFLLLTLIHRTAVTFQTTVLQTSTGCLNISGMNHVSIHLSTKLLGTNPLTWDYKFYRTISLETINVW